jgi:hypothetical protein
LAAFEWHRLAPGQIRAELADLGILIEAQKDGLHARSTYAFEPDNLAAIAPLLGTLSVVELNFSETQVANLEPLKGLTALQGLEFSNTQALGSEVARIRQYREQNGLPAIFGFRD